LCLSGRDLLGNQNDHPGKKRESDCARDESLKILGTANACFGEERKGKHYNKESIIFVNSLNNENHAADGLGGEGEKGMSEEFGRAFQRPGQENRLWASRVKEGSLGERKNGEVPRGKKKKKKKKTTAKVWGRGLSRSLYSRRKLGSGVFVQIKGDDSESRDARESALHMHSKNHAFQEWN